ncbi:MAG: type II toxin-antitoxin system HicB family antitoxin [Chloroflexota bacterium]|nr:type II toxin-antitoxin system HicB family antitoxin [Chloroflexota bacterium]
MDFSATPYLELPYTIEVVREEDDVWFAQVKELRGCATQTDSWEQMYPILREAMTLWIETALEHEQSIPQPQGLALAAE